MIVYGRVGVITNHPCGILLESLKKAGLVQSPTYLNVEYKKGLKIYTLLVCFSDPHQWCVCSYRMSQISLSWERIWLWELFAVGETPCKFCATLQLKDVSSAIVEILFTLKAWERGNVISRYLMLDLYRRRMHLFLWTNRGRTQHAAILDNCIKGIPWRFPKKELDWVYTDFRHS